MEEKILNFILECAEVQKLVNVINLKAEDIYS